jgi:excisionase family DNA binding protein
MRDRRRTARCPDLGLDLSPGDSPSIPAPPSGGEIRFRPQPSGGDVAGTNRPANARVGSSVSYLRLEDVAELLHVSTRTVRELTRTGRIPHRRIGGTRRCLFVLDEVNAWVDGCELEIVSAANGGRVVRPVGSTRGVRARPEIDVVERDL